jgi:hypothetical protein
VARGLLGAPAAASRPSKANIPPLLPSTSCRARWVTTKLVASRFWWKSGQARAPTGGYYAAAVTA